MPKGASSTRQACDMPSEDYLNCCRFRWLQASGHLFLDRQSGWTGFCPQLHEARLACLDGASEELSAVRGHPYSHWFCSLAIALLPAGELSWPWHPGERPPLRGATVPCADVCQLQDPPRKCVQGGVQTAGPGKIRDRHRGCLAGQGHVQSGKGSLWTLDSSRGCFFFLFLRTL